MSQLGNERPKSLRRSLWIAAAITAGIIAITLRLLPRFADALRRVQGTHRRVLARLTHVDYAPYNPTRSPEDEPPNARQARAAASLQEAVETTHSARNLDRFAQAELTLGETARALQNFEEALSLDRNDATILSNLAAAQLAADRPDDAAENSAKALERDPHLAPAAFNWALALEQLSNVPAAVKAWKGYLSLDPSSPWSAEARGRLAKLEAPRQAWESDRKELRAGVDRARLRLIVDRYPHRVRNWFCDELLLRFLRERRRDDLAFARAIATIRAEANDPFLSDLIEHAQGVAVGDTELIDGVTAFVSAREANERHDVDQARQGYLLAAGFLSRAGSPLTLLASLYAINSDFYAGKSQPALEQLNALDSRFEHYPEIAAEAQWLRGLIYARGGRPNDSLRAYETAVAAARRGSVSEDEIAVTALIASLLERTADPAEANKYRREILKRLVETSADDQRLYGSYAQAAYAQLAAQRPRLALAFVESQTSIAMKQNDPLLLAESDAIRSLAFGALGAGNRAQESLFAARAHARAVKNEGLRDRVSSDIDFFEGSAPWTSPPHAVETLSSAIATWQKHSWRIRAARGFLARGEAYLRAADRVAAESDFRAGLDEMEHERGALEEPVLRTAYFERADQLFDRLITLLTAEHRYDDAFAVVERKRARTLLDDVARSQGAFDVRSLAASMPSSAVAIEYLVADRTVTIWTLSNGGVTFAHARSDRDVIELNAEEYASALRNHDASAVTRLARSLYDDLIAPVETQIASATTLVFVPDGALNALPFATLTTPNGEYLIEARSVIVTPSARVFSELTKARPRAGTPLIVAQPSPSGMAALPNAATEAQQIARLYDTGSYIGKSIDPREFLRRAESASVIHFAGHALSTALVFEDADRQSQLSESDISAARFSNRPLVVLAGCSTAVGAVRRNEGVDSIANAFLHAGARAVVATMWDVGDDETRLFVDFHHQCKLNPHPSEALRQVQLACLKNLDPAKRTPAHWGALTVIGSL